MLAKKTVKNQITLPKKIADNFPDVEYFEIQADDERIVLKPLRTDRVDEVRKKLKTLKISEKDIADSILWARKAGL